MPFSFLQDHHAARIIAWSIGIFGVLSNLAILWRNNKYKFVKTFNSNPLDNRRNQPAKKVSTIINYLICHLATADLLGASYLIIIASADLYYGYHHPNMFQNPSPGNSTNLWLLSPFCHLSRFLIFCTSIVSILITFVIAIDRFITVIFLRYRLRLNIFRCQMIILACWLFSIGYALIPTIRNIIVMHPVSKYRFDMVSNLCLYLDVVPYYSAAYILSRQIIYFTLIGLIAMMYLLIIIYIKARGRNLGSRKNRVEKRIFLIMIIITISNICSLLPSFLVFTLARDESSLVAIQSFQRTFTIFIVAVFANTAINPIVYFALTTSIKNRAPFLRFSTKKNKVRPVNKPENFKPK
ncbi:G-protein coupled receptor GRL101-like protein [Trichoplax sp. H2]|nr:G-protein coupled receptor GRL101-like protein [Trichoplax sp. H2]RDD47562.1 G-protein coupled receptor GRL101-like protein [Trichoplax sp. H2]|eukprot:RDD39016.1 G-protein coupled receptor GRL101-like protein [Trichoplax sp. H2]